MKKLGCDNKYHNEQKLHAIPWDIYGTDSYNQIYSTYLGIDPFNIQSPHF